MPRARQVQNRAAISANATQHDIVQEAAERQRLEDKAEVQMVRVCRWYGTTAAHSCNVPALFSIIHTTVHCINLQLMCHR